jgi:Ca2+/Na+ antiporter
MAEHYNKTAGRVVLGFGALIGLWAGAAFIGGIKQAGSISELVRQYMVATGMVTELNTLVDYYTHIKGIEYLICVAFFVAFPVFFKYVNKEKVQLKVKR